MDARARFDSDDVDWLEEADTTVEGQWLERKEWCDANEMARQISALANGQPPASLFVLGVSTKGVIVGIGSRRSAVDQRLGQLPDLVDSCGWRHRFVPVAGGDQILYIFVPFSDKRVVCLSDGTAHRRFGASSRKLSDSEVRELRDARGEIASEDEHVTPFDPAVLDEELVQKLLEGIHRRNGLTMPLTLEDALVSRGLLVPGSGGRDLTVAAMLALGREPSRHIAGAYLRFLRFEGTVENVGQDRNVIKDRRFDGPLPRVITAFRDFMRTQVKELDFLGPEGTFVTEREYPEPAWEEAVVNALVHRSYSLTNAGVFVRMFDDRLAIESPGGFPGIVRPDNFFSYPRNPKLAAALQYFELVRLAKEGTQRIKVEMERAGLPPPVFEELGGSHVRVTLFNDYQRRSAQRGAGEASAKWKEVAALIRDDLLIVRRRGWREWEALGGRRSAPPAAILDAALERLRDETSHQDERGEILHLLERTDVAPFALALARDFVDGMFLAPDISRRVTLLAGRSDDAIPVLLSWLESESQVSPRLDFALEAMKYRVQRDPLPAREVLDRILGVCRRYPENPTAQELHVLITGRAMS